MTCRHIQLVALVGLAACGGSSISEVRYANRPVAWRVNDRVDTPTQPVRRPFVLKTYNFMALIQEAAERNLSLPTPERAHNINALDEVPDSTWFINRIGHRELSPEQIARGGSDDQGPEAYKPWKVTGTKLGGTAVGLNIEDSRGVVYILKFDEKGIPEVETGAAVVASRLLWAAGYNVPEERIVHFVPEDLYVAKDAIIADIYGKDKPMTRADLDKQLALVNRVGQEPIRALASRFLPGEPLGGHSHTGVRIDDPNDRVPHQHRRDLRGLQPIAAWIGHNDIKEDNSLDVWIQDPDDPKRHYVIHYLLDFGKALGGFAHIGKKDAMGFSHFIDWGMAARSLVTVGLWPRPWDGVRGPDIPGVGLFEADNFEPDTFATNVPYTPFYYLDKFDGFWGAKIVMRFTRAQIRAAVEQGEYSDPRAAPYLVNTLIARQRKIGRYWFGKVNPVSGFELVPRDGASSLCFSDLVTHYQLGGYRQVGFRAHAYDFDGELLDWSAEALSDRRGRACLPAIEPGPSHDGYVIIAVDRTFGPGARGTIYIHLAAHPTSGQLRIIGIRRT